MSSNISVELLTGEQWQRLRKIRLDSLRESPNAFGGQLEVESAFDEEQWRNKCTTLDYLLASIDGVDIALMSVQVLDGQHVGLADVGVIRNTAAGVHFVLYLNTWMSMQ